MDPNTNNENEQNQDFENSLGPVTDIPASENSTNPVPDDPIGTADASEISNLDARMPASENITNSGADQEPIDTISPHMPVTRGRVVYYTPGSDDRELYGKKALTAHVAEVYPTGKVNLAVLDTNGRWYQRTNVDFLQSSDPILDTSYAEWMPYQKQRAGL